MSEWMHDAEEILTKIYGVLLSINNNIIQGDQAIIAAIEALQPKVYGVKISQGGFNMSITGIPAGGQGTFEADAILNGVADPAGFPAGSVDTWTTDDANVTLAPDSGPNNSQVVASVAATDTATSFNLSVSVQMPAVGGVTPPPLVATVNVPITAAPPPVPTGVAITQVA